MKRRVKKRKDKEEKKICTLYLRSGKTVVVMSTHLSILNPGQSSFFSTSSIGDSAGSASNFEFLSFIFLLAFFSSTSTSTTTTFYPADFL